MTEQQKAPQTIYVVEDCVGNTEVNYTFEDAVKRLADNHRWKVHCYRHTGSFGRPA